jgi:hypothetical protein
MGLECVFGEDENLLPLLGIVKDYEMGKEQ